MKIAIVECSKKSQSTDAHIRQAFFIKELLEREGHTVDFYYSDTIKLKKFDVIIKVYSTFYENYKAETELYAFNKNNAKFYFLTNEYTIQQSNIFYRTKKYGIKWNIICNFDINKVTSKNWQNKYFVNLNILFYQPTTVKEKKYDIIYYGTYRKDRQSSFKKYFTGKKIYLSSSTKNMKKFVTKGYIFTPIRRLKWNKNSNTLSKFKYSLYIEDDWIHTNFHNLADRFYEALSSQTVTLFDSNCINTLKQSELRDVDYKKFLINDLSDINERDYNIDWNIQKKWCSIIQKEKMQVEKQILNILLQ